MIGKFLIFYLILRLTGNPFLAIIVLLVIYYFVDRRYIGLLPSVTKPIRRRQRMAQLRRQVYLNPHDSPAKQYLAEAYIEVKQYRSALNLLEDLPKQMQDSPDVLYDTGLCQLNLGNVDTGEALIQQALSADNRLRHGEPYLKLAAAIATSDAQRAKEYLHVFQEQNVSSCESYYRLGQLEQYFGNSREARSAWRNCLDTYRALPRFRKRSERRWAVMAFFRLSFGGSR
ncbi:tetratricopeptide repeat protein [Alicyclobacillus mengziensis]|uniref:Tetratricopeptide repeat protein n=1 Tax=Alicyclobacillus mengziensis TaxID=2931921 RepID=A0A9X7Z674_9BACL|nr:tetratricopeptide repeat protein [Alicyclobacillus mengziensis]QSO47674.1 tetratricopeptide repeat protein [Alicyclobacillus mengziensis]